MPARSRWRVPRDRNGDFEPRLVPINARRLEGFNDRILSPYARGISVHDFRSHLAQIYGVEISPDLIGKVTDAAVEELVTWQNRTLDAVWPIICIDALRVKIRSGSVTSNPVHLAVGVDVDGRNDALGLWVGAGGERTGTACPTRSPRTVRGGLSGGPPGRGRGRTLLRHPVCRSRAPLRTIRR
ncbi:transposase [Streptomyces sp. NPDC090445]|uniref:transposase n=1 Tax=Streptomyces sp. NPDC090445 TaxID=3365963 RepID=UPI0038174F3B